MKWLKRLGFFLLIILLGGGGYIAYFVFLRKEIPKTTAHVNGRELGELVLTHSTLTNRWGETMVVEQGSIVVPENRSESMSNHIAVSFIRIPASQSNGHSPLVFLAGGPGTPASEIAKRSYFYVFKKLSEVRDIILIDQRGTGQSIPNLRCRNVMAMPVEITKDVQEAILDDIVDKCKACAEEFRDMGIDLGGYNSRESAADIDDIRKALQLDLISLFGYSYGTALAQHYVSYFGEHVDQLIFAGTTAPDLGIKLPTEVEKQYHAMDSLIQADPKISRYIPSFNQLMREQDSILKATPLAMKLPLTDAVSEDDGVIFTTLFKTIATIKPYWEQTLTNHHLRLMMAQNIGRSSWTAIAPRYYYQLAQGESQRLGNYLRNFKRQAMPNALFFTVTGTTGYPIDRWTQALIDRPKALLTHFDLSFGRFPEVLAAFGVEPDPLLSQPVYSTKELLIIAGTLDGRTPLSNADTVYHRFPNARLITVQNASHDDLVDSEVLDWMIQFLDGHPISDTTLYRPFEFIPPVDYHYTMVDTLESVRQNSGIDTALSTFKKILLEYIDQQDYYYDLSQNSLNNYGYQLLQEKEIEDAVAVFRLNQELFPQAYNVYNSLAEGLLMRGDTSEAIRHLNKAIALNYLDEYSHGLLYRLQGE